jgi:hypothetical protein
MGPGAPDTLDEMDRWTLRAAPAEVMVELGFAIPGDGR